MGFETPTPIQEQAIPIIQSGKDLIGCAQTGTGKTAAFVLPILDKISKKPTDKINTLIIVPTRELALQIDQALQGFSYFTSVSSLAIYGGSDGSVFERERRALTEGADVIIATPGRLMAHLNMGYVKLDDLQHLILDEADRMLDMGFNDSITDIVGQLPQKRQTLLFSATYSEEIRGLSGKFQRNPVAVTVAEIPTETNIEQIFFEVDNRERMPALLAVLRKYRPASAVLFCNTKQRCDEVAQALTEKGFQVAALHGDLEQRDRDLVLVQFSNQSCPLLVATDVAARGLDIKDLEVVINVELAWDAEIHIHRIGRTGRAGQSGLALSLCAPAEAHRVSAIEEYQKKKVVWQDVPTATDTTPPAAPRMVTLNIAGGRRDKLRPGDILGALTGDAGIPGAQVGKIDIFDLQAFVAVDRSVASPAMKGLAKIKGRVFKVRRV